MVWSGINYLYDEFYSRKLIYGNIELIIDYLGKYFDAKEDIIVESRKRIIQLLLVIYAKAVVPYIKVENNLDFISVVLKKAEFLFYEDKNDEHTSEYWKKRKQLLGNFYLKIHNKLN
jgi:hypothetical protein